MGMWCIGSLSRRSQQGIGMDPLSTGAPGSRSCPAPGLVVHAGMCAFGESESPPSVYSISKPHPMFVDDPELPFERLSFEQGNDPLERGE